MDTNLDIKEKLSKKSVGIAGCGGLGSNCAVALARVGVGHLVIADFDIIDRSNLNRQYFFLDQVGEKKAFALRDNLARIDPAVKVTALDVMLNEENIISIFRNCDVIVEAFDQAEMKHMLIETVLSRFPQKYIVSGVGLAGWGDSNALRVQEMGKLIVCGDTEKEVSDRLPPMAPRVGIVANMEANQVMEILLSEEE